MRNLPPLNQLKAFEAAGRHGSFKRAAGELGVSDSAISQHVRTLEDRLGAPLFVRTHSGVVLTVAGCELLPKLTEAFDLLADASTRFLQANMAGSLQVSVAPSLGSRWLLPRLESFSKAHPDIQIEPIMTPKLVRVGDGEADLAIRHGNGNWNNVNVHWLRNETLVPVAAPALLAPGYVSEPADIFQYPLLTATARKPEWADWLIRNNATVSASQRFITYDTIALAIDAAISGIGVALVDRALVTEDIRQNRLQVVLDKPTEGIGAYYILVPRGRNTDPRTALFMDWLIAMAKREEGG